MQALHPNTSSHAISPRNRRGTTGCSRWFWSSFRRPAAVAETANSTRCARLDLGRRDPCLRPGWPRWPLSRSTGVVHPPRPVEWFQRPRQSWVQPLDTGIVFVRSRYARDSTCDPGELLGSAPILPLRPPTSTRCKREFPASRPRFRACRLRSRNGRSNMPASIRRGRCRRAIYAQARIGACRQASNPTVKNRWPEIDGGSLCRRCGRLRRAAGGSAEAWKAMRKEA